MEKDDKGSTLIRIGVSGESSFWYRPTRVVPDQRPLNGRCSVSVLLMMRLLVYMDLILLAVISLLHVCVIFFCHLDRS